LNGLHAAINGGYRNEGIQKILFEARMDMIFCIPSFR